MTIRRIRELAEVGVPGAAIGIIAGVVVGVMSLLAGFPAGWAIAGVLTLGVPLALLGMAYAALVAVGYVRPGTFALAALLWLVGFPLSRLFHETFTPVVLGGQPTPPDDILTFLAFQGLVSMGFAVGFVWMFERITPPWLVNIKDHNPAAEQVYARYAQYAAVVWETRERRRARRSVRLADRPATAAGARGKSRRSE